MAFSNLSPSRKYDNNIFALSGAWKPDTGQVAGSMIEGVFTSPTSWEGAQEAEIIAMTEGRNVPLLAYPILGMRNLLAAFDPEVESLARINDSKVYADFYTPMSQEEWEKSEYYREGVGYHKNMNLAYARVMADRHDRMSRSSMLMANASGWQVTGGFVASLAAGIFEPVNLAAGLGVGAGVGAALRGAQTSATLATNSAVQALARGGLARIATEGVIAGVGMEVLAHQIVDITQEEYTLLDSLLNIGASIGVSAGIQGIGAVYGRMKMSNQLAPADALNILHGAMLDGKDPVALVHSLQAHMSADTPYRFSTLTPEQLSAPQVRKVKRGFEATFRDEQGFMAEAKAIGKTQQEAIDNLQAMYRSDFNHMEGDFSNEFIHSLRRFQEMENQIADLQSEQSAVFSREARARGIPLDELEQSTGDLQRARADAERASAKASKKPEDKALQSRADKASKDLKIQEKKTASLFEKHDKDLQKLRDDLGILSKKLEEDSQALGQQIVEQQRAQTRKDLERALQEKAPDFDPVREAKEEGVLFSGDNQSSKVAEVATLKEQEIQRLKTNEDLPPELLKRIEEIEVKYKYDKAQHKALLEGIECLKG